MKSKLILFIALLLQQFVLSAAQPDPLKIPSDTPKPAPPKPAVHKFSVTQVTGLNNVMPDGPFDLDDYVILTVSDSGNTHALDTLMAKYPKGLGIWLNGIYFPELKITNANCTTNKLMFRLQCDTCKTNNFKIFYSYSSRRMFNLRNMDMRLQLGTKDKTLTETVPFSIRLKVGWMEIVGYIILGLLLVLFILLSVNHGILKDFVMFDDTVDIIKRGTPGENQVLLSQIPYSLARTQLAVWTLLACFGLLFIWLNLDELVSLNESMVVLLGISGGTSILARIIDRQQSDPAKCIKAADFKDDMKSKGFFSDLLSDEKGISIHRFQLVIFTTGLGLYFIWHVIYYLEIPEFSTNQLLLIGVSSTTYAGIKFNEK